MQQDELQQRINSFRDLLSDKEHTIKSQRTTLRLQDEKISQLSLNNDTLRHIIHVLSKHVTEVLQETLPLLPPMPQDYLADIDSLLAASPRKKSQKTKTRRAAHSLDMKESNSNKLNLSHSPSKIKNPTNCYDFSGADILSAISDLQETRRASQHAARAQGRYTIVTTPRFSLFESLSFFLSLRNVAFLNNFEIFLPRVLEMLSDLMEVERVILYIYEEEQFYSMAITGDIAKQLVIPKGFSHLFSAISQGIVLPQVYEDPRFDMRYDQISGFKTNNLACFPLKIGEEIVGMLECANKKQEFAKEDVVLLSLVAKQLALGIAGKMYQEKTRGFQSENSGKSKGLGSKDALVMPSLKAITLSLKSFLLCEKVNLYGLSQNKTKLCRLTSSDSLENFKVSMNYSFPGLCFSSKKCLLINKAQDHSMYNADIERKLGVAMIDLLLIPLGEFGVIECINKAKGFSSRDEAKAANIAVIAKEILEAGKNLEHLIIAADISEDFCDHVRQCLVCINSAGIVVKANAAATVLFEIPKEKIVGASITQLFEHSDDFLRIISRLEENGRIKIDAVRIRNNTAAVEIIAEHSNFSIVISIP